MTIKPTNLHVVFFPLMAAGHSIPILDIAKLLASHNVKTTIITTPYNEPTFTRPLMKHTNVGPTINIRVIPFPSEEGGLPAGVENLEQVAGSVDLTTKFVQALELLQEPLEQVMEECKPDCLVADMLIPFATDVAAKFDIPRLVFHGTSFFSLCVMAVVGTYRPQESVLRDDEEFVVPYLPHDIRLTRLQVPQDTRGEDGVRWREFFERSLEADARSYGVIVNSFYELEPDYAEHYRKVLGRRAWHIGPVSLCNSHDFESMARRGKDSSINQHECLKWLDSKKPNSVMYICFGSLSTFSTSQLGEIAEALEASEVDFIWVVRRTKEETDQGWLPSGFEERMEGKGLIIRGWAPQVLILNHGSIGGFMTHCGWNSTLEGIASGVPMITWPLFAEQFYNEKLVTEILKIGIGVGAKKWELTPGEVDQVKSKDIKQTIERLMASEEGSEMRNRAVMLKQTASKAVEIGGSSYSDLQSLIYELNNYHT